MMEGGVVAAYYECTCTRRSVFEFLLRLGITLGITRTFSSSWGAHNVAQVGLFRCCFSLDPRKHHSSLLTLFLLCFDSV